jgi:hypothetical protein
MLISGENDATDLNFFSPKEAQQIVRQLQKIYTKNIAALKCESRKTKWWVQVDPLMHLSGFVSELKVKNKDTQPLFATWYIQITFLVI